MLLWEEKKGVVNGGASFLRGMSELVLLASFFASMAQCICLDPSMGVSGMCGGEMNLCSLADYYCPFLCLFVIVLLSLVSGFYAYTQHH